MATARIKNDAYYTDPKLAAEICTRLHPVLVLPDQPRILEPSAGAGAFCTTAREVWGKDAHITAVEPYPTHHGIGADAQRRWSRSISDSFHHSTLETFIAARKLYSKSTPMDYDLTLGNPPFKHAEEHLALVRPISTYVAFLLRIGFLGSQGRAERVFAKPGLRYLMNIAQRPSFVHDATDKYDYACFIWQRDYTGLAQILLPLWVTK